MTTDQDDQDRDRDGQERADLPEDPEHRPTETVQALEDQQRSDPDDGERVSGDDVPDNPDADDMEDLPGPSPDEPAEPAG